MNNQELNDYLFTAVNLVNDIYAAGLREGGKIAINAIGKQSAKVMLLCENCVEDVPVNKDWKELCCPICFHKKGGK